MSKKNYDEVSVIRSLSKKNDISVDSRRKVIEVVKNSSNVGNGSWGKIDYLCNYHGYRAILTNGMIARKERKSNNIADEEHQSNNHIKHFDVTKNIKDTMKKVKL